jgi:hypothetical protein
VRRLPALALGPLLAAGCTAWAPPTSDTFAWVSLAQPGVREPTRLRLRLDIDSPWLSGQFEGAALARPGPEVRLQLFPDLGGKAVDLLATPTRIVGYFPQLREGIDMRLPGEARPHPLAFLGLHLLERAAPAGTVTGWRPLEGDSATGASRIEARLNSVVEGATAFLSLEKPPRVTARRLRWMYGVEWTERPDGPDASVIEAPRLRVRLTVLERQHPKDLPAGAFELTLPPDVRKGDR